MWANMREFLAPFGRQVKSRDGKVKIGGNPHGFESLEFVDLGVLTLDVAVVFNFCFHVLCRIG